MINQYSILKTLGSGSFGKVKLVGTNLLDRKDFFAMKMFNKLRLKR